MKQTAHTDPSIHWEPAQRIAERQTDQLARQFRSSRPRPRNSAMGFSGMDGVKRQKRAAYGLGL